MDHPYFADLKETQEFKDICSRSEEKKESRGTKEIKIVEEEEENP